MGVQANFGDLDRDFSRWFGENQHGRPELAFWGAITGELVGDTSSAALDQLTDHQNADGIARLFALLDSFLAAHGITA